MSLSSKLLKIAKNNPHSAILADTKPREVLFTTDIPAINIAISGELDGGMHAGILQIVGDSRTFKTCYALLLMSKYLQQYPDAMALFFDSEGGASFEYFDQFGIDKSRVIHLPIVDVEDMRIQCAQYLKEITREDKVFFFIDSVGLLPSRKEIEDAEGAKTTADMTRARALNSFWRIVTIPLQLHNLPMVAINHYYDTMSMFPEKVIKGGKGGFLASNDIWLVTRSKEKDGKELIGWSFNITIMKSRTVEENAKIPVIVTYENFIDKYSGLLNIAVETGHVKRPTAQKYVRKNVLDDREWKKEELNCAEFWEPVLADQTFKDAVKSKFKLNSPKSVEDILQDADIKFDPETGEVLELDE